jgi:predicted Zn-dependent protease
VGLCAASLVQALACACLCALFSAAPVRPAAGLDGAPQAPTDKPAPEDPEVRLGRENAEANDKTIKLVTDAAIVDRVNRIGQELAVIANSVQYPALWGDPTLKKFNYTFKVVDDKDVNAYSLPGGFIYVNKGLINYCHSDDELAGVLAHEITHAAHHHMIKLIAIQKKLNNQLLPVQLIALAGMILGHGRAGDTGSLLFATQLIEIAKLNGYGIEAEKDADHGGMLLMTHTHYNPVGLYSFMLREARDEELHGPGELGIFRNHPPGPERAESARALLDELKLPIDLADVDPALQLKMAAAGYDPGGQPVWSISVQGVELCRVAAADGMTAEQRVRKISARLSDMIYNRIPLQPFEVRVTTDEKWVTARYQKVLTEADAAAQQKSVRDLAQDMRRALEHCLLKEHEETGL